MMVRCEKVSGFVPPANAWMGGSTSFWRILERLFAIFSETDRGVYVSGYVEGKRRDEVKCVHLFFMEGELGTAGDLFDLEREVVELKVQY